jgi:hypothetical protein
MRKQVPARGLEFVFVCPNTNHVFKSADFHVSENRGVVTDEAGNKVLDATVVLDEGCPFCGAKHSYPAGELSCPFGSSVGS